MAHCCQIGQERCERGPDSGAGMLDAVCRPDLRHEDDTVGPLSTLLRVMSIRFSAISGANASQPQTEEVNTIVYDVSTTE